MFYEIKHQKNVIHLRKMEECTHVQPLMSTATKSYWVKTINTQTHIKKMWKTKKKVYQMCKHIKYYFKWIDTSRLSTFFFVLKMFKKIKSTDIHTHHKSYIICVDKSTLSNKKSRQLGPLNGTTDNSIHDTFKS